MTISDVIWHRLDRIESQLAASRKAYDDVDEPELIAALEVIKQMADECLELARRKSTATGLRVVRQPIQDGED